MPQTPRRRMSFGRRWSVYEATGNPKQPLRLVACIRANAKSIATGAVHRGRNIPKRELVTQEGCPAGMRPYTPAIYEQGQRYGLYGASRSRKRRRRRPLTGEQIRAKIACKVFGGKACR